MGGQTGFAGPAPLARFALLALLVSFTNIPFPPFFVLLLPFVLPGIVSTGVFCLGYMEGPKRQG